jgi:hypothetical protein
MVIEISLNCSILGSTRSFPVDILSSKTVGHLRDAIKKENELKLNHIDADALEHLEGERSPHSPPSLMYIDTLAA